MSEETKVDGTPSPVASAVWQERVGKFADKVGKTPDEVSSVLKGLVGEPSDDAAETLADKESCPDSDLLEALSSLGIPKARLRKNLAVLRGPEKEPERTVEATSGGFSTDILPSVPDDESFVAALRTGGVLKVDRNAVVAAIKTALAARVGLYDIPDILLKAIEEHAETLDEPCSEAFYEVEKLVHQRGYADVLGVVSGRIVSERRKSALLRRLDEHLWTALRSFHGTVSGWQEAWMAGSVNPNLMMAAIAASMSGGALPPGMMQPPDTSPVRDAASAVNDRFNKVFSGAGIPVAKAMAFEAQRVKKLLADPRLPAAVGAPNYEQMLKKLNTGVSADYERLERNIAKYALATMELPNVASGQHELTYLGAMLQLGLAIQWDRLAGSDGKKTGKVPLPFGEHKSY